MTPHTDLCRRLRAVAEDHSDNWIGRGTPKLLDEAAAAIECQGKEIRELRAAVRDSLSLTEYGLGSLYAKRHTAVIGRAQEEGE